MFLRAVLILVLASSGALGNDTADDTSVDNSRVAESCRGLIHLLELFTLAGTPQNKDAEHEVTILINHGYALGFSEFRKQPVWAAYEVSAAKEPTDYKRPPFFYDDPRLPESQRIGEDTFGGGYDRGHMVPNFAINRQYGKMAQMETFFMSNICPQKAELNQGLWQRLEHRIVTEFAPEWEHIWVICGRCSRRVRACRC